MLQLRRLHKHRAPPPALRGDAAAGDQPAHGRLADLLSALRAAPSERRCGRRCRATTRGAAGALWPGAALGRRGGLRAAHLQRQVGDRGRKAEFQGCMAQGAALHRAGGGGGGTGLAEWEGRPHQDQAQGWAAHGHCRLVGLQAAGLRRRASELHHAHGERRRPRAVQALSQARGRETHGGDPARAPVRRVAERATGQVHGVHEAIPGAHADLGAGSGAGETQTLTGLTRHRRADEHECTSRG